MKKICRLLSAMLIVAMVLSGCGKVNTLDTEANTQQIETESTTETQQMDTEKETTHTHAYTEVITTGATCEADGVKTLTCECGDSYTKAIKAIGHDYEDVITAPTCSEKGYTTHTCKTCSNVYTDTEVSASGHSYGGYTYNNDATYEKDGTETATCSACGNKNTRTKTGTKLVKEEPKVESFPHALNSYWYDASTDAVYFYHVDGLWDWSWYETACQVLDQNTAIMGVHTMTTSSVGTYAEGKIIKVKVFKQPVN